MNTLARSFFIGSSSYLQVTGPVQVGTQVSMATDITNRVIMGKCYEHSSAFIF